MDKIVKEAIKNKKDTNAVERYILQKYRDRKKNRLHPSLNLHGPTRCIASEKTGGLRGIEKFKEAARIIKIFISVCNRLKCIAAEHGRYNVLKSDANVELHTAAAGSFEGNDGKNLMFDPGMYKSKSEAPVPGWVFTVCQKSPEERTEGELRKLCCLMKQVEIFQKYTKGMLSLMAKTATCSRYERGRVIVRKGHIGRSLYVVLNGSAALLQTENEKSALKVADGDDESETTESDKTDKILRKGDSFGREAFFKNMERQATVVCLSSAHFLMVNLDHVNEIGLEEYLNKEMLSRNKFLRQLPIFENLPDDRIRMLAEKSHTFEYLSDKVIEKDSGSSEYIYICRKGQCTVMRKIGKKRNQHIASRKRKDSIANDLFHSFLPLTAQYQSATEGNPCARRPSNFKRLPDVTMHIVRCRHSFVSSGPSTTTNKLESLWDRMAKKNYCNPATAARRPLKSSLSLEPKAFRERIDSSCLGRKNSCRLPMESDDDMIIQVAQLSKGDIFGLSISDDDGESNNESRTFILVSSGCEVIAFKRQILIQNLNHKTKDRIRTAERKYASDEELYNAFCEQKQWKLYREQLVGRLLKWKGNGSSDKSKSI